MRQPRRKSKTIHREDIELMFDDKTFQEARDHLESIRIKFNTYEVLYGCKVTLKHRWGAQYTVHVSRMETDDEMNKRLERNRKNTESRQRNAKARLAKQIKEEQDNIKLIQARIAWLRERESTLTEG